MSNLTKTFSQKDLDKAKLEGRLEEAEDHLHDETCLIGEWMGTYTSDCTCDKESRIRELEIKLKEYR